MDDVILMKPNRNNTRGIRYLGTYGASKKKVTVRLEIGSRNGKHGEEVCFYCGEDIKLATMLANRINYLLSSGKSTDEVVLWKNTQMQEEISRWNEEQK